MAIVSFVNPGIQAVFRITSKWTYLPPQKVPNASKFWDKDVSKRPEFPELRPKFERWTKRLAAVT